MGKPRMGFEKHRPAPGDRRNRTATVRSNAGHNHKMKKKDEIGSKGAALGEVK